MVEGGGGMCTLFFCESHHALFEVKFDFVTTCAWNVWLGLFFFAPSKSTWQRVIPNTDVDAAHYGCST